MILKFIYTIFIGLLFATLVGVGIAAFYPQPKAPDYPSSLQYYPEKPGTEQEARRLAEQKRYDQSYKAFESRNKTYNRDVSIISLVIAVVALLVSLTLFNKLLMISDGILLGGLLTLLYSIIRGFETDDNIFRFVVVAVGFISAIVVGYIKFTKPALKKK